MSKNKKWSSAAKFEIALQAIKNETTLNEICKKYEVTPSQVHAWKKQLLEQGSELFNKKDKTAKIMAEHEETKRVLYETVGQLTVERDFLKKCWEQTPRERRQQLVEANHAELSLRRQCELLQINRSTIYYQSADADTYDVDLLNEIREIWERYPFYGYRRIAKELKFLSVGHCRTHWRLDSALMH